MQVPQLAFQGSAQPPTKPSEQDVETTAREAHEEPPSPVAEEPPRPREQMVQGLMVGGAALVYEDALEPSASPEPMTLQAPAAATDQLAQAPPIEPEPPGALPELLDIPEVAEAPESPQPAAEVSVPEPPRVETPIEVPPAEVAEPPEERPAEAGARRWFLRRRPSAEPEAESADEAAVVEQPVPELPEVEEMPDSADEVADEPDLAPVGEVAREEDLLPASPSELEHGPEPQEATRPADQEVPLEEETHAPAPEVVATQGVVPEQEEAPEPVQPRARKWLRRRGAPAPAAPAPMAPSGEAIDEVRGLEAPAEDQAPAAAPQAAPVEEFVPEPRPAPSETTAAQPRPSRRPAPATAGPPTEAAPPRRPPQAAARTAEIPARPAASAAPAPVAPPEAEPHAPSPWSDQPYYVEATPERATEPPPRLEPTPDVKPSLRERLTRRRPVSPSSLPIEPPPVAHAARPTAETQTSGPVPAADHEVAPTVSAARAPAPVVPPQPAASVVPPPQALAPPRMAPPPTRAPVSPPPRPARAPMAPPPSPAPVAPPSSASQAARPPATSAWKSSTPQPPSATVHTAGVQTGPSPVTTEITCPRCGQPSPRGLCETCEYALLELRELMIGLSEDQ